MEQRLDDIIEGIYAAALDSSKWQGVLREICRRVGAVSGFYAGLDVRQGRGAFWHTFGHTTEMALLYNQNYLGLDPTLAHIIKNPGTAFSCNEYLSDANVAASRFHAQFMIPHGLRHVLSGVISLQGSMISLFGFQRLINQPPFSRADTAVAQRLIPHFAAADRIAAKVGKISDVKQLAMSMLDRLDYGIVFVSKNGQIQLTNQRAELWLEQGALVRSHFGRIQLSATKDSAVLDQMIRAVGSGNGQPGRVMTIETATIDGATRARVIVLPMSQQGQAQLDDDKACAALVISHIDQQRQMAPQLLSETYRLTRAETKVLTGLVSGKTQDELADSLCVSLSTIKSHTQHIYQKTGLSRQVDLVRLVYGLPALF